MNLSLSLSASHVASVSFSPSVLGGGLPLAVWLSSRYEFARFVAAALYISANNKARRFRSDWYPPCALPVLPDVYITIDYVVIYDICYRERYLLSNT